MTDLNTQLREYTNHIVERIEAEDILHDVPTPLAAPVLLRSRSGWLVGVLTAVVVLVVGLATLMVRQEGEITPRAGEPTHSVPVTTLSVPVTTLSVPVTTLAVWSRVPHDEVTLGGASMSRVTAGGPGLVAVGEAHNSSLQVVWTSSDGITWSRVPHHESFSQGAYMKDVTAGGPGLVVVGGSAWFCRDGCEGDAVVWTSVDGTTWSRVPHDEGVFGGVGAQSMVSVTVGGPGLVAVGAVGWDSVGHDDVDAAVWTSVDGTTWSRVPHDEGVFGGTGIQTMASVTAGGPGLVAVGADESSRSAAIWTSVDGVIWSRVPHDEALFGGVEIDSVTTGGPGLVAVGDGEQGAAVWTSIDGIIWSRVPHDEAVFGGKPVTRMRFVTEGGPGLVAVGREGWNEQGPAGDVAIWTSVDGITWTRVPYDEATFGGSGLNSLAAWELAVGARP